MKFTCQKEALMEAINTVQRAVAIRTTSQVLSGILIKADKLLHLTGNDLALAIEYSMEAMVDEEGSIVLDHRIFSEIVRRLPEDIVRIETDKLCHTTITSGQSVFQIMGMPHEEYPAIPEITHEKAAVIPQMQLKSMIQQTLFAVSTNETRLILTGSLMEIGEGGMNLVSVDGYRLAFRREPLPYEGEIFRFVVPGKTLSELSKILRETDENVSCYVGKNAVQFEMEQCKVYSRLLEGDFLNYEQIIPKDHDIRVVTAVRPLMDAIERTALVITSEAAKYPLKFKIEEEAIRLSCITQTGMVQDEVRCNMVGDPIEIGFNHRYFLDALKACDDDMAVLEFSNPLSPCVIRPSEGDRYLYLVLPVRLRSE